MGISALIGIESMPSSARLISHIQTVFPGFAHADDTAGTGTHAFSFDLFQGLDFHVIGVGGADIREISAGRSRCYGDSWSRLLRGDGAAAQQREIPWKHKGQSYIPGAWSHMRGWLYQILFQSVLFRR